MELLAAVGYFEDGESHAGKIVNGFGCFFDGVLAQDGGACIKIVLFHTIFFEDDTLYLRSRTTGKGVVGTKIKVRVNLADMPGVSGISAMRRWVSDDALAEHCAGYFHETGNVGAFHVVDISVGLGTVFDALVVDVAHDLMESLVYFTGGP